jgi:DNA repair exonuclease SbcCD nuclease subunit
MRFIHTADWHISYRQYGFPEREQDIYRAVECIATAAIASKVDVVLIAGDLFDNVKPQGYAVEFVQNTVRRLKDIGIDVWGIDGNHDATNNEWLRVCGIRSLSGKLYSPGPDAPVFYGIDATRPALFHAKIDEQIKQGAKIDVLVIHQALGEMADFDSKEITAFELAPKLQQLGVRYVAMGDIHDYKEMVVGGIRFVYPGAVEVKAIDEDHDKSYSVVEITKDTLHTAYVPIPTRAIVEVNLREQADLDNLLAGISTPGRTPLMVVWYTPEARDLAKRAEAVLKDKEIMYRIVPLSTSAVGTITEQLARQSLDRKDALTQLRDAVKAFFEEGSDQYQLVLQMLGTPDNTVNIMKQYLKSKGVA